MGMSPPPPRPRAPLSERIYLRELTALALLIGFIALGWVLWSESSGSAPAEKHHGTKRAARGAHDGPVREPAWQWDGGSKLLPRPARGVTYYVTRCAPSAPIRIRGRARDVSPPRGGELRPGRSVSWSSAGRRYHARCLPADFPEWSYERSSPAGQIPWRFWAASPGMGEPTDFAVIWNSRGVPVWWTRAQTPSYDTKLTSSPAVDGGAPVVMWSTSYGEPFGITPRMRHEIHSLDGRKLRATRGVIAPSDHHDAKLAADGNELITSYRPRPAPADLGELGMSSSEEVLDGVVQELDPAGRLVWSWDSKDHISVAESAPLAEQISDPTPYPDGTSRHDLVHLNSVEEVPGGRLLMSFRRLNALYLIDRQSGAVIWKLGGTHTENSLELLDHSGRPLPQSEASEVLWQQHDARSYPAGSPAAAALGWSGQGELVSAFDNATGQDRLPRAILFGVDEEAGTAQILQSRMDPRSGASGCCGSANWDPETGAWAVAWGGSGLATGFTPAGRIAWRMDLDPRKSYRLNAVPESEGVTEEELWRGMEEMPLKLKR